MKCPFCGHLEDKVVDSRESREGEVIRRRRECLACAKRFTSYERIDQIPPMVVKKDGRRERFDRGKVMGGLLKACEKRPVPVKTLELITDRMESMVHESPDREVTTDAIGEYLMERLRELDKVAFVRFASVYKDFKDVDQFMATLKGLLEAGRAPKEALKEAKEKDTSGGGS
jgi:transcriptional repressor NrdR